MKQSPGSGAMATSQPPVSLAAASTTAQSARRAQRLALSMFALTLAIMTLAAFQLWQSAQWQIWIVLACLAAYAGATLVAWRQFGAGRLARGGWILVVGMYLVFPISATLTAGTSLTLAICLFTLTLLLAPRTLPTASATRAISMALILSILTLFQSLVDLPWRAQGIYANTVLPFVTVGLLVILAALTVRSFPTFSLRSKLIIVSLTVSLVPLGVIGLIFTLNAQQNATTAANQALQADCAGNRSQPRYFHSDQPERCAGRLTNSRIG